MRRAVLLLALFASGCVGRPAGLNWLPPEAHGSRPELRTAAGGANGNTYLVRDGRVIATVPGEGRGGFVYLPSRGDE